ncbi:MAG: ATP-binding protein [Thermoanaerobaculia bacterium]
MLPTGGWYFIAEFTSGDRWESLPPAGQATVIEAQREIRVKLALTLVASILVLAGTVVYLRRTVVDPLANLARRARTVGKTPWETPLERNRPDEIGDLARALDNGVQALEHKAQEAARFSINLSHELRTPLAAIRGAAEILAEGQLSEKDQARFVGNIVTESERLERLVVGMLELSRTELGRAGPARELVDLVSVARSVLNATQTLLQRKGLRVVGPEAVDWALVLGDADRLHRILFGLLENAIKFSPEGGEIRVDIHRVQEDVRVVVADEGPGVPIEIREKIFERQFTTEHDGGSASRGTGLGLAIVRGLVSASSGRVWVEDSTAKGARFVLAFRAAQATPSPLS